MVGSQGGYGLLVRHATLSAVGTEMSHLASGVADDFDQHVLRSRRTLVQWEGLPTATKRSVLVTGVAKTEIGVLEEMLSRAPISKRTKIEALINRWLALAASGYVWG